MLRREDPRRIEPLYRAHFDAIFRFAACRVGRDAALDVAAETFAQALRRIDRLDPARDARPWLFGVAVNVLRHHHRTERRRLAAYARAQASELHHAHEVCGRDAGVADALLELQPGDRDALLLFAWADLSYEEIAAALDIPVGTVRSRINRARRLLRAALTTPEPAMEV
jgi:RNA polymerase sigma factor (sigma-70 family)